MGATMTQHNTRINPDVLQYWQDQADHWRVQRNELRDLTAEIRGALEMDIPVLRQVALTLPASRELTLLRAVIARWEVMQARLDNPHEESTTRE